MLCLKMHPVYTVKEHESRLIYFNRTVSTLLYVTGYWKTDHNVTLGQLHFVGPANSHTHALSMH